MSSVVSIGLQDKLHRRQSSLRTSEEVIFKRQETKRGENFPCAFLFGKEATFYEKFFAAARQDAVHDFVARDTRRDMFLS